MQTVTDTLGLPSGSRKGPGSSRVAVVGCGRRFETAILPVLKECDAHIVAVIDPDPHARDGVISGLSGQRPPVTTEVLSAGVLRDTRPDMAIVASPSGLHYEHAKAALASGIATYVEKPLACSTEEAVRLRSISDKRLAVSEQRVHRSDLQFVRACISSGSIGRVKKIVYQDTIAPAPSFGKSWRNDLLLAGGGVLLDLGYHTINTLQWLLDSSCQDLTPTSVRFGRRNFSVEDHACISCSGQGMELRLSVGMDRTRPGENLLIQGTQASVQVTRRRSGTPTSLVELHSDRFGTKTVQHRLDNAHDTRSLRDFLVGDISNASLDRHVATVRLLESFYHHANDRKSMS